MGARRLLPTRRRGRARGVTGLLEPGDTGGAGGEERVAESCGGGMVGLAGAGRLAGEEGGGRGQLATRCPPLPGISQLAPPLVTVKLLSPPAPVLPPG